ncbi:MAG: Lrp/AsnC family transcriptional regulator [Clostridia bacterium]|nr:Lrp/AsnC family transcriptional regulator [Clostridia bacterium]
MEFTHKILNLLERNATYSAKDVAELLGSDEQTVAKEIDRLKQNGVILGTKTLINWDKVSPEQTVANIELKVTPQKGEGFDKIAKEIYTFPEVRSVALMSGGYDLSVTVVGNSMKDVAMFVGEKLSTLDTVVSTATHFVLKNYKVDGVFYTDEPRDERMIAL